MDETSKNDTRDEKRHGVSARKLAAIGAGLLLLLHLALVGNAMRIVRAERAGAAVLERCWQLQWCLAGVTAAALVLWCGALFVLLLDPLGRCAERVRRSEELPADRGLAEFRRLAYAYNGLLRRRQAAETVLHRQNRTDALTGLSNRLAFETYVAELAAERPHTPVTVFSLDVNGLKETNDREGHVSGDALLRNCAACIVAAFGDNGVDRRCFRFGGDEFAAFWEGVPVSEVAGTIERFEREQAERSVSVSVGYAHTEDLSGTTVTALYEEADKHMYDNKAEFHRQQAQEVLDWLKLLN